MPGTETGGTPAADEAELDAVDHFLHRDPGRQQAATLSGRVRRRTLIAVTLIMAASGLDSTVISVALPTIRNDLGGGVGALQWISSVYLLALAITLVPAGRLSDAIGPRTVFRAGVIIYLVSCLIAAVAPDSWVLILGRAGQGIGAGAVGPAAVVLIDRAYGPDRIGRAFAALAMLLAISSALGPVVGGTLTDTVGWRWIFVIHGVIALAALALSPSVVAPEGSGDPTGLSSRSILALALIIIGIQVALIQGGAHDWLWLVPPLIVAALAGLYLRHRERTSARPMLDMQLLRRTPVLATVICRVATMFAFYGNIFYLTLFLQSSAGYSAAQTGLILLPSSVIGIAAAPITGRLVDRYGPNPVLVAGTLATGASLFVLAFVHETSSVAWHIGPGLTLNGIGYSLASVSTRTAPLKAVPEAQHGSVTALVSVLSKMAGGFGITFATGLFNVLLNPAIGRAMSLFNVADRDPIRDFIVEHIGTHDLPRVIDPQAVAQAGFHSVEEALGVIDKSFALTYSLLVGILGALVMLSALGIWILLRRSHDEPTASQTEPEE